MFQAEKFIFWNIYSFFIVKTFKILSSSFFKYTVRYHYLWSPYLCHTTPGLLPSSYSLVAFHHSSPHPSHPTPGNHHSILNSYDIFFYINMSEIILSFNAFVISLKTMISKPAKKLKWEALSSNPSTANKSQYLPLCAAYP
jgi:hypothetical protein